MAEWALKRRRLANGDSIALGPIAELPDHELELADAAELPVLRALLRISKQSCARLLRRSLGSHRRADTARARCGIGVDQSLGTARSMRSAR